MPPPPLSLSLSLSFSHKVTERREKDALMKSNLSDLSGKVETLTATLDRETTTRQKLEEQVSVYWLRIVLRSR